MQQVYPLTRIAPCLAVVLATSLSIRMDCGQIVADIRPPTIITYQKQAMCVAKATCLWDDAILGAILLEDYINVSIGCTLVLNKLVTQPSALLELCWNPAVSKHVSLRNAIILTCGESINGESSSGERIMGLNTPGERMSGCRTRGERMIGEKISGFTISGDSRRGERMTGMNTWNKFALNCA